MMYEAALIYICMYVYAENPGIKYIDEKLQQSIVSVLKDILHSEEQDCYRLLNIARDKTLSSENKVMKKLLNMK